MPSDTTTRRGRNPRGHGGRLREEIVDAAIRLLDELGDDQALSMRAVTREIGSAATSVYLHFADRDALVLAALERYHAELVRAIDEAVAAVDDPVEQLRARIRVLGDWAYRHPGMYKVLHESTLNQRADMAFKQELTERTAAAIRRCMDAGLVPVDDPVSVMLDLRAAVHGAVSMRLNEPGPNWPPLADQIERFFVKLVGIDPTSGNGPRRAS
ncbi:TetR/AcrR family transcriptional regulator [Nocardia sp. CA-119907]|uniref:TetR/AcrR family transcriptional regulator n=1 Tax=Nocardia sp. CA-119907 TaxID=3239973 RepID=UPI003D95FF1D